MAIRARVDRHKCIGAGNCITLAPTAFDWLAGDFGKADVVGPDSVDEEVLRTAAFACPTGAIVIEDVEELLPWQLRGKAGPARRVLKTFMFTDIVGSTNLVEVLGDDAWDTLLRWHDTTLREVIVANEGAEISTTGDGLATALLLLQALGEMGLPLHEAATVMERLPQRLVNVRVRDKDALEGAATVWAAIQTETTRLGGDGRVLVRPSGTEPLVRVMAEAATQDECDAVCARIVAVIEEQLGAGV